MQPFTLRYTKPLHIFLVEWKLQQKNKNKSVKFMSLNLISKIKVPLVIGGLLGHMSQKLYIYNDQKVIIYGKIS